MGPRGRRRVRQDQPGRAGLADRRQRAEALKTVFDPEIPVDIYELGLIYKVDLLDERRGGRDDFDGAKCLVAGEMPIWVEQAVMKVDGVRLARADIVFDPPWDPPR